MSEKLHHRIIWCLVGPSTHNFHLIAYSISLWSGCWLVSNTLHAWVQCSLEPSEKIRWSPEKSNRKDGILIEYWLTMFMAFFTNFMSSKLTVRWMILRGFNSTPGGPLRGVSVSLKNEAVATNINTSTTVCQKSWQIHQNPMKHRQSHEELFSSFFFFFFTGTVGNASGSEIWRVHASKRDIKEVPSPREWWILNIPTASASEVLTLRRWRSQRGWDMSMVVLLRLKT